MRTSDPNRINTLTATAGVIAKHKATWQDHLAFNEGVDELTDALGLFDEQSQVAEAASRTPNAQNAARRTLGFAVSELIGAMRAYAARTVNPEIVAQVADVISGEATEIVTRCRAIHAIASSVAEDLTPYGISATKLSNVKKKIDAFDGVKSASRQSAPAPAPVAV